MMMTSQSLQDFDDEDVVEQHVMEADEDECQVSYLCQHRKNLLKMTNTKIGSEDGCRFRMKQFT